MSPNTPKWTSIEMEVEHFKILKQDLKTKPYPKWAFFKQLESFSKVDI
jgi:hypothetical protein